MPPEKLIQGEAERKEIALSTLQSFTKNLGVSSDSLTKAEVNSVIEKATKYENVSKISQSVKSGLRSLFSKKGSVSKGIGKLIPKISKG